MHTASGLALFFPQSCSALERTAFALNHFATCFQIYEALAWLPFLFDNVSSFVFFPPLPLHVFKGCLM